MAGLDSCKYYIFIIIVDRELRFTLCILKSTKRPTVEHMQDIGTARTLVT
jgi:hypothetical protein